MATKKTVITQKKDLKSEFFTESIGSDERIGYHTEQNVAPVIEHVKHIKDTTLKPGMDMRHVAEVPMIVYQKAMREGWANGSTILTIKRSEHGKVKSSGLFDIKNNDSKLFKSLRSHFDDGHVYRSS